MRRVVRAGAIFFLASILWQTTYARGQAPATQSKTQDKPFVVEYYDKVTWGNSAEFVSLFRINHYPYIKNKMELGQILQVTVESPNYHATEAERWDYRGRIVWQNVQVANDDTDDERSLKTALS